MDYFADEAKEHLESATKLMEEIEHNAYASQQVGGSGSTGSVYSQADQRIDELRAELANLSAQSRELCSAYVKEKRDGYIQVSFTTPAVLKEVLSSLLLTALFVAALGGIAVLDPFYQEYRSSRTAGRKKKKQAEKKEDAAS